MKPITVEYVHEGETGTLTGWPTGVPGLVVSKSVTPCGDDPCYAVTHVSSGAFLGYCWTDPEATLGYAHAIASHADWTADADGLRTQVDVTHVLSVGRSLGGRRHPTEAVTKWT